jgi:hypothetical protein
MTDKISRAILSLLVAAGLALAAAPNAALAGHCKGKHKNDPGCDGGGGGGVIFSVAVVGDPDAPAGANRYLPSCTATTPESTGNSITTVAFFPRHDPCAILTTSEGYTLTDDIFIETVTDGAGAIVAVQLFGQDIIGAEGIAHETDELPVDPVVMPDAAGFTLHVHAADVDLWKLDTHRVMRKSKRVEWVGTFTLDDMIYTPDP